MKLKFIEEKAMKVVMLVTTLLVFLFVGSILYTIVKNVVIPAIISVFAVVPCSCNLKTRSKSPCPWAEFEVELFILLNPDGYWLWESILYQKCQIMIPITHISRCFFNHQISEPYHVDLFTASYNQSKSIKIL